MAANGSTTSALTDLNRAQSIRQDAERQRKIHEQTQALLTDEVYASEEIEQRGDDAVEMGRQACLALSEQMHAMLPMELRDMIYHWIIGMPGEHERILGAELKKDQGTLVRKHITYDNARLWQERFSHPFSLRWWCDSYMGKAVALELVERWYTTRKFTISREFGALKTFLNHDPFQKNIQPSVFIQHLTLEIWPGWSGPNTVAKHLSKLLQLSNKKATITFSVVMSRFWSKEEFVIELRSCLNLITPTCRKLHALGIRNVTFRTADPKHDLTHLIDGSESAVDQALDEISNTWESDLEL
ncbi:hypothetical protein HBH98_160640 [Parastagonospora nodorum]|nr:hypothetical protein HBH52_118800 [Parastagonospora nodorum]KAH4000760.1 hypothetical protein HBI10_102590 [Parastagonospora nodorum]KAH4026502.1 hypothetical protein HBI13_063020 [Parastagonospora nodorum]KAH4068108.1 hypothetical protein HBH50_122630 [Parastagonospora nodorum]KAH4085657.1 hypothetical protein HBH48_152530 [Parastagonospora nodorum]